MRKAALIVVVTGTLAVTGCAPVDQAPSTQAGPATAGSGDCTENALKTREAGKFTFGTDQPAYPPWFVEGKPDNGKGFESAVAYAVAGKLGYGQADVKWTSVPFNAAIQPGAKSYDGDINQFTITDDRRKAVDFSAPYYSVPQGVVALKSSPAASVKSIGDLKQYKIGAQVGTTSYDSITKQIGPNQQPAVYNTNDDAKAALDDNQIQALVVDLATAFEITAELPGSVIVGQLPIGKAVPDSFGIVLDKGSPLTRCVSAAVDALRVDGTLTKLDRQWLAQAGNAPELK